MLDTKVKLFSQLFWLNLRIFVKKQIVFIICLHNPGDPCETLVELA